MKALFRGLLAGSFFLLLLCGAKSFGQPVPDEVWVAIRVIDKGPAQLGSEYYGSVEKKVFQAMLASTNPTGFLKLNHVAWLSNGKIVPLADPSNSGGANFGYGDVVYFRIDTIFRIVSLNDTFVKENFLKSK
jgi:hypothetical protein